MALQALLALGGGLCSRQLFAEPNIGLPVGQEATAASAAERMSRLVQDYDGLPG